MFGDVTALDWLHVTGKYRDRSMQHTCSRPCGLGSSPAGGEGATQETKSTLLKTFRALLVRPYKGLIDSGSCPTRREDALIWDRPRVVYHRVYRRKHRTI